MSYPFQFHFPSNYEPHVEGTPVKYNKRSFICLQVYILFWQLRTSSRQIKNLLVLLIHLLKIRKRKITKNTCNERDSFPPCIGKEFIKETYWCLFTGLLLQSKKQILTFSLDMIYNGHILLSYPVIGRIKYFKWQVWMIVN